MKNPFKKEVVKEIHHTYDILPEVDWNNLSKEELREELSKLTRIQMLELQDRGIMDDHVIDYFFDVLYENHKYWPTDNDAEEVLDMVPVRYSGDKSHEARIAELEKRLEGIQKKVDKITSAFSETEITMSGETFLKL